MGSPSAWDIITNSALQQGIIGHWKLNALTGASSNNVQDSGPNGLHGTAVAKYQTTGAPIALPAVVSGKIRNALDFEGGVSSRNHQRIELGNNTLLRPAHISVSAWVWLDDDGTHRADDYTAEIVSNFRFEDSPYNGFLFRHRAPAPYRWMFQVFAGSPSTGGLAYLDYTPTFNTWHHAVGTYDGIHVRVYANGVLLNTLLHPLGGNINYGTGPDVETWIAGYMCSVYLTGQSGVMRGRLDEVTIWDRAITDGDVALLHNNGAGRFFDMKTAGWWDFDGVDQALRLPAADAPAFDPSKNNDDFTVAGVFQQDRGENPGIICKSNSNGVDKRCWAIVPSNPGAPDPDYVGNRDVWFSISKNGLGGAGNGTDAIALAALPVGEPTFFCGRYEYNGDGDANTKVSLKVEGATEVVTANAVGPVYSDAGVDVQIADVDHAWDRFLEGGIYWLAYWNRKLTDQETLDLHTGAVHPRSLAPDFYWDGHQAVAATYVSELPLDPRYWEFDVEGTPTKGGSSELTLPVPIGIIGSRPEPRDVLTMGFRTAGQIDNERIMGRVVVRPTLEELKLRAFGFRTTGQIDNERVMGRVVVRPTLEELKLRALGFRVTQQKSAAKRQGLASLLRFSRKRGR